MFECKSAVASCCTQRVSFEIGLVYEANLANVASVSAGFTIKGLEVTPQMFEQDMSFVDLKLRAAESAREFSIISFPSYLLPTANSSISRLFFD